MRARFYTLHGFCRTKSCGRRGELVKVLLTGGAGYIGSHAVLALTEAKMRVTIVDNLSTGSLRSVPADAMFVQGDLNNRDFVSDLLHVNKFDAVVHFAASTVAPESVRDPFTYYRNNTSNTIQLGACAAEAGVRAFVFSSTAAVYGTVNGGAASEHTPQLPSSPYGWSKLMSEQILRDMGVASCMKVGIFRYFNVAGADPGGRAGQRTPDATHLIKVACQYALGQRTSLTVYGTDFDTPDGTGVRDYIHVTDLVEAHVLGLKHLLGDGDSFTLNCGYGRGYSVLDVVGALERLCNRKLPLLYAERREGDPAISVANVEAIRQTLNWTPKYDDLDEIVRSAFEWEKSMATSA